MIKYTGVLLVGKMELFSGGGTECDREIFRMRIHQNIRGTIGTEIIVAKEILRGDIKNSMKVNRDFYNRDTLTVAQEVLGKTLVHVTEEGVTKGKIVEVEAYIGSIDKASHAYQNLHSERTKIQYGEGGYAYVYLIYGMYICMNIVTNKKNMPEVILIRALEPLEGIELMKKRRKTDNVKMLCNGPGKLSQAMGITKRNYGDDLCGERLYLEDEEVLQKEQIIKSKRINIDYAEEAKDFLWRFTIKDNPYVSR